MSAKRSRREDRDEGRSNSRSIEPDTVAKPTVNIDVLKVLLEDNCQYLKRIQAMCEASVNVENSQIVFKGIML